MSLLDTIMGMIGGSGSGLSAGPGAFDDRFASMDQPDSAMPPQMGLATGPAPNGLPIVNPPMPRPRPMEAGPGANMLAPDMMAPAGMPMAPAPDAAAPGLMSAAVGPDGNGDMLRRLFAGIGGGLSNVRNSPFKGEVLSQSAGGALTGIDKSDTQDKAQKLAEVDRRLKKMGIEQLGSHREDLSDARFINADAATARARAATQNAETRTNESPSRIALNEGRADWYGARVRDIDESKLRLSKVDTEAFKWYKQQSNELLQERTRLQSAPMKQDEKRAAIQELDRRAKDLSEKFAPVVDKVLKGATTPAPQQPPRPGAAMKPPASVPEISFQGDGTTTAPYQPATADDYDQIPSGAHFLHRDGSVRVKP